LVWYYGGEDACCTIMDSPQTILRNRIIQILGPTGNNTLSWVKAPVGAGYQYELGCWIGDRRGQVPATHGIAVGIDGLAQYEVGRYDPTQRRNIASCGFVMDLWMPEDINVTSFGVDSAALAGQGIDLPIVIESMDISGQRILNALKDLDLVRSVRMLPPMQRGVYGGAPTLERMRCNVVFQIEMCIESKIA
jgi:hypothetical protein